MKVDDLNLIKTVNRDKITRHPLEITELRVVELEGTL